MGANKKFKVEHFNAILIGILGILLIIALSGCNKEELPDFCQCHEEHELDLGTGFYPYPSNNTEPKDGFCEDQTDWIYLTPTHRYKITCQ